MSRRRLTSPVPLAPALSESQLSTSAELALEPVQSDDTAQVRTSRLYEAAKRLFDVTFCLAAIVALTPIFGLLAVVIKLSDGGPVLYRREIVGRHGKHFFALKFRTMIPNADEFLSARPDLLSHYTTQIKLRDDPRVTRVGRVLRHTSLDELPQLFNVLRGQMSLVGPRMIHPTEVERFGEFARIRQLVRPGITGLWQVSGRQHVSYAERVGLDKEYMRRRSFWLDLRILGKTVFVVLRGQGAY
jgi:lipopolysaccharide/colanic/teichoic acid biosynthesis glycosyltransferase